MSQYPPQPPQQPPYGQPPTPPPYGQPGMPQYGMPGAPTPRAGTSGAAIASLICGILGCIPFVTSLLAIILGIIGIKSTSGGRAGGRGRAIGGLILGLLGIIGWSSFGVLGFWGWSQGKKLVGSACIPFVQAVGEGDYTKAANHSTMSEAEMAALHDQIKDWGTVSDMSVNSINAQKNAGTPGHVVMSGKATFPQAGTKDFDVELDNSSGVMKIVKLEFK